MWNVSLSISIKNLYRFWQAYLIDTGSFHSVGIKPNLRSHKRCIPPNSRLQPILVEQWTISFHTAAIGPNDAMDNIEKLYQIYETLNDAKDQIAQVRTGMNDLVYMSYVLYYCYSMKLNSPKSSKESKAQPMRSVWPPNLLPDFLNIFPN